MTSTSTNANARRILSIIIVLTVMLSMVSLPGLMKVWAAEGDTPAHSKTIEENGDGTYKLELSVTGDADNEDLSAAGANIALIYDVSQSMTNTAGTSTHSRADEAEDIVHDFLDDLLVYKNKGSDIRVSLVTFARTASKIQGWTDDVQSVRDRFDDGTGERQNAYNLNYTTYPGSYGTNWDHALGVVQDYLNDLPNNNPTFVIMFTDGAPTAHGSNGADSLNPETASFAQLKDQYKAALDNALAAAQTAEATGGTFFGIYAYGTEADLLDDLMYYSTHGTERADADITDASDPTENYYNASETAVLKSAIDKIFNKIIQAMGIGQVVISDGTTHEVATSSGDIELLEVDTNSYQYWIEIPVVDNKFSRVNRDGTTTEYTVTEKSGGTCDVTWGTNNSVTVKGSVSAGKFKYEWTESNALYDYDPPAAVFQNSKVDWNLSTVGTLLDGVTYSVTFDVYPSQTTLDYIADIRNDPGENGAWKDLDSEVKKYIDSSGNLQTNTTATLTYKDTRTGQDGSTTYDNPDPIESDAVEQLVVTKSWENELDEQSAQPVGIKVTRDGSPKYTVDLSSDNDWSGNVYISIGIMRTKKDGSMEILTPGHDFTFTEPDNLSYHWELDVPTVRPMLIDNRLTMLIKVDDAHQPGGAKTYTINGAQYYVGSTGAATLSAANERRSSLILTKAVTGEYAPADAEFPFTLNVVNSNAASGTEGNHNSDYYVWLSVWDKDSNPVNDAVTSGAIAEDGSNGWYYAKSGDPVYVNMKAGYTIRINNLPSGSTYTFTEGTLPAGFVFTSSGLTIEDGSGSDSTFKGGQTTTGTIESTNTLYKVTYTNDYELVDVTVNKAWADNSNQDGKRPVDLTLTVNNVPQGVTVPTPEITKNGNTWTYTWKGLPRYTQNSDGKTEIIYTVTENDVPEGYECTGSPANNKGTITNTHTPEKTAVSVQKVWDDNNNIGNIRPAAINVQLYTGEGDAKEPFGNPVALNVGGLWAYTWENLDKYADGVPIVYTVDETEVPNGYTKTGVTGSAEDGFNITNKYSPKPVSVNPLVQKVISGKDDLYNKGNFTFTIEGKPDSTGGVPSIPMPDNTSITNSEEYEVDDNPGFYAFDEIKFTEPGTYEYIVKESGSVTGVTNDPDAATGKPLKFVVKDDGTGQLVIDQSGSQVQLAFTNTYNAEGEATITVAKVLEGA